MAKLVDVDPGNAHSFPYLWGTTGIGYNIDKIKEIFGTTDVVNSWDLVFKPENLAKLKVLYTASEQIRICTAEKNLPRSPRR